MDSLEEEAAMIRDLARIFRQPRRWMPHEKWDALVKGDSCLLCREVETEENDFSFLVARLETSNLRLVKNQYARGYCVLLFREHACELHELPADRQAALMRDLSRAGTAIASTFKPDKMNYQLLGNLVPHIHWHIVPRYWGDPAPGRPIDASTGGRRFLQTQDYRQLIAELQETLDPK
jgi:diadenosine tetraphosphate (Ap4A) HIT family hydrolase